MLDSLARCDGILAEVICAQIINMESLSQPITAEPSQYRQKFVQRLDILRTNESFCDVTITAKGKEFRAHRAVLAAASPFFLTLLTSDMRESNEQLIRIELEEATVPVMEDVLKYVYTGNVSITEDRAHNLIATADYLLLSSLKTMAENFLKKVITTENCIFSYYFAERYQCIELKENSRDVINSNFSVVIETEDFLKLDVKKVMEWVSSDDITVSAEEEVFKGIVNWVSYNKKEREGDFPELLDQVRLTSIAHDFVLNELMTEELITKNSEFFSRFALNAMKSMLSASCGQVNQQPRKCLETHTDGIFVCGGKKALCYLPQQNIWYRLADTPFNHQNHGLTECKGKIYVVDEKPGKLDDSQAIEYYMPTTNSWGAVQINMFNLNCCTVLKGYLYAAHLGRTQNIIYKYDTEMNYWDKVEAPPIVHGEACVVADEQYFYIIGGTNFYDDVLSATARFDPSSNKWKEVAPLNEKRYRAFGAAMNGKVYIAGGLQGLKVMSSCEMYNTTTNEWQLLASLILPRFNASMVCYKGTLYVVGGATLIGGTYRVLKVEEFDSKRNKWANKSTIPVKGFESLEDEKKKNQFQACSARLFRGVIEKLEPLNLI